MRTAGEICPRTRSSGLASSATNTMGVPVEIGAIVELHPPNYSIVNSPTANIPPDIQAKINVVFQSNILKTPRK